jgi:hypothetical protein
LHQNLATRIKLKKQINGLYLWPFLFHFMKSILLIVLSLMMTSCVVVDYQLFDLTPANTSTQLNSNYVIAKEGDLELQLDFWSAGGYTSLKLINNSPNFVYVDLKHSHFVIDGQATSLYTFSQQTTTSSSGTSRGYGYGSAWTGRYGRSASGLSISSSRFSSQSDSKTIDQDPVLILPPNSFKYVDGFELMQDPIAYCSNRTLRQGMSDSLGIITENKPFSAIAYRVFYYTSEATPLKELRADLSLARVAVVRSSRFFRAEAVTKCKVETFERNLIPIYRKPNRFYLAIPQSNTR